jgi:hypothetical protein
MHTHIVMDRNGDTRHEFDPDDVVSCARAEEHFGRLTAEGFRAVGLGEMDNQGRFCAILIRVSKRHCSFHSWREASGGASSPVLPQ